MSFTPDFPLTPFSIAGMALVLVGMILFVVGAFALVRLRLARATLGLLGGTTTVALGGLAGAVAVGVQGYRALSHEQVAARIDVRPIAPQRFVATFRFPDDSVAVYSLNGDAIYVDAHVLKWKPWANVLGLHTAYELNRVAGRYNDIEQERSGPRTVHSLVQDRPIDLFALRRRYAWLAPFFDAEYGSGSFVAVDDGKRLELRVSTSGLLLRPVPSPAPGRG